MLNEKETKELMKLAQDAENKHIGVNAMLLYAIIHKLNEIHKLLKEKK